MGARAGQRRRGQGRRAVTIQAREPNSTPWLVSCAAMAARSLPRARLPGGIKLPDRLAGHPEAADEVRGSSGVPAVVDGLVHAGEADPGETGGAQDIPDRGRLAEREGLRGPG